MSVSLKLTRSCLTKSFFIGKKSLSQSRKRICREDPFGEFNVKNAGSMSRITAIWKWTVKLYASPALMGDIISKQSALSYHPSA
jgi:hypothetical protein